MLSYLNQISFGDVCSQEGQLAGCKKKRARLLALQLAPPHSWIHAGHYSTGSKVPTVYLLCTPHGPITVYEEYFCWVYAVTGKMRMSRRIVNDFKGKKDITPKERARVADLIDMHNRGVINLNIGPWEYYGYPIGSPSNYIKPLPKDYMECLIRPSTSLTTT